jgi:hypothetical protein
MSAARLIHWAAPRRRPSLIGGGELPEEIEVTVERARDASSAHFIVAIWNGCSRHTEKNPGQGVLMTAASKTRHRDCGDRAVALDCAQLDDANATAEPEIKGKTVTGSCAH